jgi:uncharacterized membrane protein YfcA
MKIDRMGVMVLMSHLIITLAVIGAYLFTLYKGAPDEALKTAITIIIGYWFGAMGGQALRTKKENKKEDGGEE